MESEISVRHESTEQLQSLDRNSSAIMGKHRIKPAPPSFSIPSLFKVAANGLAKAFDFIRNPYDPHWRNTEKYQYVLGGIKENLGDKLQNAEASLKIAEGPKSAQKAQAECQRHLKRTIQILDGKIEFRNERERYKAFMSSYTKALESPFYKGKVKEGLGGLSAQEMRNLERQCSEVGLLHAIARAQYTGVNVTSFLHNLSKGMANESSEDPETSNADPLEQMSREIALIDPTTDAIKHADPKQKTFILSSWASSAKGQVEGMNFDPLNTGGNPANVHYQRVNPDGSVVTFIRLPSPTIGPKIHPSFKAFLRTLKANDERYFYVNLQDRRPPSKRGIAQKLGVQREDRRVAALEKLNSDPEFAGVVGVASLDKGSSFYWQNDKESKAIYRMILQRAIRDGKITDKKEIEAYKKRIEGHETFAEAVEEIVQRFGDGYEPASFLQRKKNTSDFIDEFQTQLFSTDGSFYIPDRFKTDFHKDQIKAILTQLGETCFEDDRLTPLERQDFIELAYDLIEDYMIAADRAQYANTSCKDCIDRGGAEKAKKQAKDLIMEALTSDEKPREDLTKDIQAWHHNINGPPLWARKRAILPERRVRLVQAMKRMMKAAESNPDAFVELQKMVRYPEVEPPASPIRTRELGQDLNELEVWLKDFNDFDLGEALKPKEERPQYTPVRVVNCIRDCSEKAKGLRIAVEEIRQKHGSAITDPRFVKANQIIRVAHLYGTPVASIKRDRKQEATLTRIRATPLENSKKEQEVADNIFENPPLTPAEEFLQNL